MKKTILDYKGNVYMFDPPGFAIELLPRWYRYIESLERLVTIEDPNSEQAKDELAHSKQRLANLEVWRDREQAEADA